MTPQFRAHVAAASDSELYRMLQSKGEYTAEAIEMIEEEVRLRGRDLGEEMRREEERRNRLASIRSEIASDLLLHVKEGKDLESILRHYADRGVEGEDVRTMIVEMYEKQRQEVYETTSGGSGEVVKGIIGAVIAALLGGVLNSIVFYGRTKIFFVFVFALIGMCYGIVRWFSGGKRTTAVYLLTIAAALLSFYVGLFIYEQGWFR